MSIAEISRLRHAVAQASALHKRRHELNESDAMCEVCRHEWPCETLLALRPPIARALNPDELHEALSDPDEWGDPE